MEKSLVTMKLKLSDEERERLRKVAEKEHRSVAQQVAYYIEQGVKRDEASE